MSPTSVCYTVTAKIEDDLVGSGMVPSGVVGGSSFGFGIRKQEKVSLSSSLKVGKDAHRIRKPPLPLPQVQYRPPIIIHTYSPKVIHTQPDDFMSLVQKLTGSSDTRLRLKRKPSKRVAATTSGGDNPVDAVTDLEQQGTKTSAQCGSPSSSEESVFLANSEATSEGEQLVGKQSTSPRSPLSNFEFDNQDMMMFTPFDSSTSNLFSHVKSEPSFSFNDNSFNFFTDFSQPMSVVSKGAQKQQSLPKSQLQQEFSPFPSIDINSPLASPGFLFPGSNLTAGLPDLSPATASWSHSFFDCLTGSYSFSFTNQPPIQRQRFSSGNAHSSEGTMVALENIQAFMST